MRIPRWITFILPRAILHPILRLLPRIPDSVPDGLAFKIAETAEELESAFRLLHDAYVKRGLMQPHPSGMRVTPYHALPSSTTLIGKIGHRVVATLTIIRDNPMGLPCDAFTDLSGLRKGGTRVAEISSLAIERGLRRTLLFHLLKYTYELCAGFLGVDHLIAALTTDSGSHQFYESILFFKPLENKRETRPSFSNFRPVIAEHLQLEAAYHGFENAYSGRAAHRDLFRFFAKDRFEGNQYPSRRHHGINFPTMDEEKFRYFYVTKTDALREMSTEQLQSLAWIFQGRPQETLIDQMLLERNVVPLDRRGERARRFPVSCEGMVRTRDGRTIAARILDISREGMKIAVPESVQWPARVILVSDEGIRISVNATRVWESEDGCTGLSLTQTPRAWDRVIACLEQQEATARRLRSSA